jgi:hypothetical protein
VVVRLQAVNHPRWEDEVLEVRPLDDTVGVGQFCVMVRKDGRRTHEVVNECVEYVDGARAAYSHVDPSMDFWIAFDFTDTGAGTSELTVTVRMTPHGALRLMTPLFRLGAPKRSARIVGRTVQVIEQTPAYA